MGKYHKLEREMVEMYIILPRFPFPAAHYSILCLPIFLTTCKISPKDETIFKWSLSNQKIEKRKWSLRDLFFFKNSDHKMNNLPSALITTLIKTIQFQAMNSFGGIWNLKWCGPITHI